MMSSMMVNAQLVSSLETFRYIKSPKTLSGSPWLHFPCETNISLIRRLLEVNMSAYGSALRWSLRGESLGTFGIGGCGILVVMDIFEEVVRMRRAGERGALATIVHTNGSIPSYESSRMLVRDDGSIVGARGGGGVDLRGDFGNFWGAGAAAADTVYFWRRARFDGGGTIGASGGISDCDCG